MKFALISVTAVLLCGTACHRTPQEKEAQFLRRGKEYLAKQDYPRAVLQFRNAVQLAPKDAEAQYQLGLAYLSTGDLNHAVAALFQATQVDPQHLSARLKLAELMTRSGDPAVIKDGQKRLQELLATAPDNHDALNALALSELELGEFQNAEQHLQEALRRFPNNLSSSVELAALYLRRKDTQKAEQVLKRAQAAAPRLADVHEALGEFYVVMARLQDAETAFRSALQISPSDTRALLGLAAVERRLGKKREAEEIYRKLADLPDKRYQHLHAAYLFAEGQKEAGVKEFEKLAKSGDRAARTRLVEAYVGSGKVAQAESALGAALKENPKDVDARLQRSQILMENGKQQEAESDLNQVIHFSPDSAQAHYQLAQIYHERGNRLQENAELTEALRYNPGFLPARLQFAQLLTRSHSPKAALEVLSAAPDAQKEALPLLLERNYAQLAAGDTAAFRQGVAQALQIAPTPDALLQDAVLKMQDRDFQGARASIDQVLKQRPDDLRAVRAKALSYEAENHGDQAVQFLSAYAANSKSPAVEAFVAQWLWAAGQHDQARTALLRAKSLDPHYAPARLALAQADFADQQLDSARMELTEALTADPSNVAVHILLANLETKAGNPTAALEQYRKALELNPQNASALNNLAYILADQAKQPDEALHYAQQAVELAPGNADALGTLGWVFYQKGLYQNALQVLSRAATVDGNSKQPNAVLRRYHLAMVYLRLGDQKKGTTTLVQALQENPNLPEARMAQALVR